MINICQVVPSLNENTGGVAVSVANLAEAIAYQQNFTCHLFTLDYLSCGPQIIPENVKLYSYSAPYITRCFGGFYPEVSYQLQKLASRDIQIIHNHGLWMFPNLYARQSAIKCRVPFVISPRGMLESWSLGRSRLKKGLAWWLYEQKNLRSANLFHATSDAEAKSIRNLGFQQPIAVIRDGVQLPDHLLPNKASLLQQFPQLQGKPYLLFLSRLHPKKGLDTLLQIWQQLVVGFPSWHLVIAGPDSGGYQAKLERLVSELHLHESVTFTGMLSGTLKAAAFYYADLFVLPTHSENFGIAIAEALSYEVPVVTTHAAPWAELESHQCGWWVPDDRDAIAAALKTAMQLSPAERKAMGQRGRELVASRYTWDAIGREMAAVYRWLVHGGEPPACVLK
ncbi:glycosyltransferase [Trichothermofontia sp.]